MENIEKGKVLAAVVRTFFKYFTLGIIEGKATDTTDMSAYEPKNVKLVMSRHIEDVSRIFNQEAFYAISRMNYIEEELERELTAFVGIGNSATPMQLMQFACRTDRFYEAMVTHYKRNFEALLCGNIASPEDSEDDIGTEELGVISVETAESIINRIANKAYEAGKGIA